MNFSIQSKNDVKFSRHFGFLWFCLIYKLKNLLSMALMHVRRSLLCNLNAFLLLLAHIHKYSHFLLNPCPMEGLTKSPLTFYLSVWLAVYHFGIFVRNCLLVFSDFWLSSLFFQENSFLPKFEQKCPRFGIF